MRAAAMRIECRLFADLRRHAPPDAVRGRFGLELEDGVRVRDVVARLGIEEALARIVLVNGGTGVELDRVLRDGDVLSIFPPVSGG